MADLKKAGEIESKLDFKEYYGTTLNSTTEQKVLGPPERKVVPAGSHIGNIFGSVFKFAQGKLNWKVQVPPTQIQLLTPE